MLWLSLRGMPPYLPPSLLASKNLLCQILLFTDKASSFLHYFLPSFLPFLSSFLPCLHSSLPSFLPCLHSSLPSFPVSIRPFLPSCLPSFSPQEKQIKFKKKKQKAFPQKMALPGKVYNSFLPELFLGPPQPTGNPPKTLPEIQKPGTPHLNPPKARGPGPATFSPEAPGNLPQIWVCRGACGPLRPRGRLRRPCAERSGGGSWVKTG